MQTFYNVLTVVSFGVSLAVLTGGLYVYVNKDTLLNDLQGVVFDQVKESLPIPSLNVPQSPVGASGALLELPVPFWCTMFGLIFGPSLL